MHFPNLRVYTSLILGDSLEVDVEVVVVVVQSLVTTTSKIEFLGGGQLIWKLQLLLVFFCVYQQLLLSWVKVYAGVSEVV